MTFSSGRLRAREGRDVLDTVHGSVLDTVTIWAFACLVPRGLTRLLRSSCSGHNTVNGAGIGCADHTPSMLDVLLLVVHRTLLVFAWTGT